MPAKQTETTIPNSASEYRIVPRSQGKFVIEQRSGALSLTVGQGAQVDLLFLEGPTSSPLRLSIESDAIVSAIRIPAGNLSDATEDRTPTQHQVTLQTRATFDQLDLKLTHGAADWSVLLSGRDARAHIYGIQAARARETVKTAVSMKHQAPACKSFQFFKCIAEDAGTTDFRSRVIVDKDATDSDAHQSNRNLVLGDQARTVSEPELEIYTDAVKCSHGSTTGKLDSAALFYLRSRGISLAQARSMLLDAFGSDLLASIDNGTNQDFVAKARTCWDSWLHRGEAL